MFAWTFLLPSASYARMAASRRASSSDITAVRGHVVAPIDVFSRQTPRKTHGFDRPSISGRRFDAIFPIDSTWKTVREEGRRT
jgi:hypothetical protein